jgi:hypothetical protein
MFGLIETKEINLVKKDLTSFSDLQSNKKYHKFIKEQRKLIYGDKVKFDENFLRGWTFNIFFRSR